MFDAAYYRDIYPDIAASDTSLFFHSNPFFHYLLYGAQEGRNPNPLFDGGWYLKQYPDVEAAKANPLAHYLCHGASEGRNPHPLFDGQWYLENNPDVEHRGINPLLHYLGDGWQEGRDPVPWFDSKHYLEHNPDVARSGMDPFIHFLRFGRSEGRSPQPESRSKSHCSLAQMLPANGQRLSTKTPRPVDIVIPVYKGLNETRRCIESVLGSSNFTSKRVVIINDCSPDHEIGEYLDSIKSEQGVLLLQNPENMGFVATVNRGMSLSEDHDIVLLNSDTEVSSNWLDRLAFHAYSDDRIGTVTPFSNNATICSYPTMQGTASLPANEDVGRMDKAFEEGNRGRSIEIPTAVGFCMFIRRDCLSDVGLFDVDTFGKGYGEENDFCMRARKRDWRHLLAGDIFVYHRGEVSFEASSSPAKTKALSTINQIYPGYGTEILHFYRRDPAKPMRVAATAARLRLSGRPVVLMVTHQLGGGTEKHVQELVSHLHNTAHVLLLRPSDSSHLPFGLELTSAKAIEELSVTFLPSPVPMVSEFLRSFGISRIHVHHLIGMPAVIYSIIQSLGLPFDLTVHDYFTICPRFSLIDSTGMPCGEPDALLCNKCLSEESVAVGGDILWWRAKQAWLLGDAQRVICPSLDTAQRIARYYPDARILVAYHEKPVDCEIRESPEIPELAPDDVLRVAVLGALTKPKGADFLLAIAEKAREKKLSIHFRVIGYFVGYDISKLSDILEQSGPYSDTDLQKLLQDYDPHLIFYPAIWNETYCYTLTEALKSRRPLLVPEIGAFPERVANHAWCWSYPHDTDVETLLAYIHRIRADHMERHVAPRLVEVSDRFQRFTLPQFTFYPADYQSALVDSRSPHPIDLRVPQKVSILAVVETNPNGMPSPCSYIRIILPLQQRALHDRVAIRFLACEDVLRYRADIVLTNRVAIPSLEMVDRIVDHCQSHGMRLFYDLDDDLLGLPDDHPEAKTYEKFNTTVSRLIVSADRVWTSTSLLAERIRSLTSRVTVVPNELDARVWPFPTEITGSGETSNVKVLYMGTPTHGTDFMIAREALKRICQDFGLRISVEVIGAIPSEEDISPFTRVHIPSVAAASYPAFVRWLADYNCYDIGIAPLVNNAFNECKSHIKFLDYAALGLAVIASDVPAYRSVIEDGKNGLLVQEDENSWYNALHSLLLDPSGLLRMRREALEFAKDRSRADQIVRIRLGELRQSETPKLNHADSR